MSTQENIGSVQVSPTTRTRLIAAIGVALAALFAAIGIFWDATGNDGSGNSDQARYYPVILAIIAVVAIACYGLVVRGAGTGNPGRRSAVLGGLGLISLVVFWAGVPVVLASAAVATALIERDRLGSSGGLAKAGLVLAGLTTVAAAVLAVAG